MSTRGPSRQTGRHAAGEVDWAFGLAMFAGALMLVGGLYHVLAGIAALVRDRIYVSTPRYTYAFDITGWGWALLALGVLVAAAGVAVLQGRAWGRVVGIILAVLSMIVNFLFIPYYPIWSLVIIAVDILVIWALFMYQPEPV